MKVMRRIWVSDVIASPFERDHWQRVNDGLVKSQTQRQKNQTGDSVVIPSRSDKISVVVGRVGNREEGALRGSKRQVLIL